MDQKWNLNLLVLTRRETASAGKPLEFGKVFYHVKILELQCAYTAYTALSGQWNDWAWNRRNHYITLAVSRGQLLTVRTADWRLNAD